MVGDGRNPTYLVMKKEYEQKLEHIISRMQADTSVDAPSDALKYVKDLFRTRGLASAPTILERIAAVLKIDLEPNRAAFGERSAAGSAARQMLFDSGENAIDLRITSTENGFDIRGQILGGGFDGADVTISEQTAAIDEMGGFKFGSLSPGEHTLVIRSAVSEIVIEKLILK